MKRQLSVVAAWTLACFVIVIQSVGDETLGLSRRETGSAHRRAGAATQAPTLPYGIPLAYYSVRGELEARLTLNNKGPNALTPRVTLYSRDGRRHVADPITIPGRTFAVLDLRALAASAGPGGRQCTCLVHGTRDGTWWNAPGHKPAWRP
jgi:hypothetical protein